MTKTANEVTEKTLTIPVLKKFHARADVRAAIAAIKSAQNHSKRITAHVESYLAPAFAAFAPFVDENGARITARKNLYMCENDAQVASWYAHCDLFHAAHGYNLPAGYCPALSAQEDLRKCEQVLLSMLEDLTGADFNRSLELRAKALDLFLNPPMK